MQLRRRSIVATCVAAVLVPAAALLARGTPNAAPDAAPDAAPHATPPAPTSGTSTLAADAVRRYEVDLTALDASLVRLRDAAMAGRLDATRAALADARVTYKRVELLAEHYTPLTARAMNGPPVERLDDEDPHVVLRPSGLQVIATALADDGDGDALGVAAHEAAVLRVNARRLRETVRALVVTDAQLFDAARLEIARVTALGLAGADVVDGEGVRREAAAALGGVGRMVGGYAPGSPAHAAFAAALDAALRDLAEDGTPDDAFGRYAFIAERANPLARALAALRVAAGVPALTDRRPFAAHAATLFDAGAFDPQAYAPPDAPAPTAALVALGETLFHEPALSGRGDRSCATCHQPSRAFTDGRPRAATTRLTDTVRNTPTLIAAALQPRVLADGGLAFLEDQVAHVVGSPAEMAGDVRVAAARLAAQAAYRERFAQAFGTAPARAVTPRALQTAIAAYVRTLRGLDAPFDRAMRDDGPPLAAAERRGFDVFMGKGRCGTCHFAPLFGGTVPPAFTDAEVEVVGVPSSAVWRGARVDPDPGAGAVDGAAMHAHAFRTPSLRNVARTAPYMHNGVYRTLDDVVELYDRGGGAGIGVRLPNQTLSAAPLHLTRVEKRDLVAFLLTLSDGR